MPFQRGPDRRKAVKENALPTEKGAFVERRRNPERRRQNPCDCLQLFSGIPETLVGGILAQHGVLNFAAGEVILTPGQKNDSIYLLLSGRLQIHLNDKESSDFILINPGECVGEMSIIDGKPVSAYVLAETTSRVLVIHEKEFWGSLIPIPGVARNLLCALSERMRMTNQVMLQRMQQQLALKHMLKELQIARGIQTGMLPSKFPLFPDRNEVDLFAVMNSAREVGGDFYDAFFITPRKLFICVGDVSGKGVSAALFMVRSLTQIRMEALRDIPPNEILRRVNKGLCENNEPGMFVTVFCGVLDTGSGEFTYSNGGHNAPFSDLVPGTFDCMPMPRGILVGVAENATYASLTLKLRPGQTVVAYTDGVTEALNQRRELFSDERLRMVLSSHRGADAKTIIDAVRSEIDCFIENTDQSDDITLLAVRYLG